MQVQAIGVQQAQRPSKVYSSNPRKHISRENHVAIFLVHMDILAIPCNGAKAVRSLAVQIDEMVFGEWRGDFEGIDGTASNQLA